MTGSFFNQSKYSTSLVTHHVSRVLPVFVVVVVVVFSDIFTKFTIETVG